MRYQYTSGVSGIFDMKPSLKSSAFKELSNESFFRLVRPFHHCIMWTNELDISSDTIINDIQKAHHNVSINAKEFS
jgi:hypothetical protein